MSSKIRKELKDNKYTVLVFCIFLGLFIIGWLVFGLIMPNGDENKKYGNRLDDIEEAGQTITKEQTDKIIEAVEKKNFVNRASTTVEGRIINVIVEVKKNTSTSTAKSLDSVVLDAISSEQKKLYDVQLLIKNENEKAKGFPMIGYKNSSDKGFVF